MTVFRPEPLKKLIYESLEKIGVCEDSCIHVSESLVQTSLRGVDSHGINLFPHYHSVVLSGRIKGAPSFSVDRTGPSVAVLGADHGFGHHSGAEAMLLAVDIAKETGVGSVSVKNSNHIGALAYFGLLAAERGMVGICMTHAPSSVIAYNAKDAFFGTNPICIVAPMRDEGPFCLDMATSSMPTNKLENYKRTGIPLPPGWAFDENGKSVSDPHVARYVGPYGGHKGYGLGMAVDIFSGLLTGSPFPCDMVSMMQDLHLHQDIGSFFMALDIARFYDVEAFKARLQDMTGMIRALSSTDEQTPVMIPGDPEKKTFALRSVAGIPVDEPMYKQFLAIDERFATAVM